MLIFPLKNIAIGGKSSNIYVYVDIMNGYNTNEIAGNGIHISKS